MPVGVGNAGTSRGKAEAAANKLAEVPARVVALWAKLGLDAPGGPALSSQAAWDKVKVLLVDPSAVAGATAAKKYAT